MTWLVPPLDRALSSLERYVRATWKIHGIVVAGSIVRGEAGPTSDLDVCVVHTESWRQRDQRRFENVPAEIFVNPPDRIRASANSSSTAHTPPTPSAMGFLYTRHATESGAQKAGSPRGVRKSTFQPR